MSHWEYLNSRIEKTVGMSKIDPIKHSQHDLFNLTTLPLLIAALLHYCYSIYIQPIPDISSLSESPHSRATAASTHTHDSDPHSFLFLYCIGQLYFLVDMIWLILWPRSVSSPNVILIHHLLSSLGWLIPLYVPVLGKWVASCFLVEINTFFLIARRNLPESHPFLSSLIHSCFHLSWILLRLVLYPAIVYYFSFEVLNEFHLQRTLFNFYSFGWILVFSLTCLNLKWSYDLYFHQVTKKKLTEGL